MKEPAQRYIVAATPRTGSSLLCEALAGTGVAGRPAEVFAPDFRWIWFDRWQLPRTAPFADYFEAALRYGTGPNGVYGMKIQWMHVDALAQMSGAGGCRGAVLSALFPDAKYIHIVRRDRGAQVRSWFRAIRTGEWWRFADDTRPAAPEPPPEPDYMLELEGHIAWQQAEWNRHFDECGIEALRVEYEMLSSDRRRETERVLSFLGLDTAAAARIPPARLIRQSRFEERESAEVTAQRDRH
jgi:trehalose 2-sulfotransferase